MRKVLKALVGANYLSLRPHGPSHMELLIQPAMLHYKGAEPEVPEPSVP